jgi:hypothetical protein
LLEGALEEVHFPNRNAAGSHDSIALVESVRQREASPGERIRDKGIYSRDRTGAPNQRRQDGAIALINPARFQRPTWLRQF